MKISVIIPFYNSEEWLERCCESLKQDGDFEVILVDDFSSDKGKEIAESYDFIVLDNKHNKGVSGARNTGIDYASGEWITFLDADDEMLPNAYKTFTKAIKDANIIQLSHRRLKCGAERKAGCLEGTYLLDNLPKYWWGVWNKLFRADLIKDIRFDETLQYGEDGMFVLECLKKDGKIYHAERELATTLHRFDNSESLSKSKTPEDVMNQCHAYEEFLIKQDDPKLKTVVAGEMVKLWDRITRMLSIS